ncbi:hypothetical protein ScPMuIL_008731 [Solemya velum]
MRRQGFLFTLPTIVFRMDKIPERPWAQRYSVYSSSEYLAMADREKEILNIKAMLRAVLQSSKEGVPPHKLQRDYCEFAGDCIPFKAIGYKHLDEFIQSIPDVVTIKRNNLGDIMYHAVADESTAHIQRLVSKQKSKKTKSRRSLQLPSRKPISHSSWHPSIQSCTPGPEPRRMPQAQYRPPQEAYYSRRFEVYQPPHTRRVEIPVDSKMNMKIVLDNRQTSQHTRQNFQTRNEDLRKKEAFELPPRFRKSIQDTSKSVHRFEDRLIVKAKCQLK